MRRVIGAKGNTMANAKAAKPVVKASVAAVSKTLPAASQAELLALKEAQERDAIMGIKTAKGFETKFLELFGNDAERECQWLEMSMVAPNVFGPSCFDKSKDENGWSPDYLALKGTLEHALYFKAYKQAFPEVKRLAKGEIPTARDAEIRENLLKVRGSASHYINEMGKYFARANAVEQAPRKLPTLAAWAASAHTALAGKVETVKSKAVAPKIQGAAPQCLLDLLAILTLVDAKESASAMQAWREQQGKEAAHVAAVTVIQGAMHKARKGIKSDAPKGKRTAKA
jgi:hypothetical protein